MIYDAIEVQSPGHVTKAKKFLERLITELFQVPLHRLPGTALSKPGMARLCSTVGDVRGDVSYRSYEVIVMVAVHAKTSTSGRQTPTQLSLRHKLIYSAIATSIGLIIIELACRLIVAASPNARWNYHANLVVTIGFEGLNDILEPDSQRFWRLRPNVATKELRGDITEAASLAFSVTTDDAGHRWQPQLPDTKYTVLFLGDSCTFGVGVDDDQTFPAIIQRRLGTVRCVNAGVPGYTSFQGGLVLEDMLSTATPDVVVIAFLFNDNLQWDQMSDLEHAEAFRRVGSQLARHSRLAYLLSKFKPARRTAARAIRPRLSDHEYSQQLRQMVARCQEAGSQPILMVWPMRQQMKNSATMVKQDVVRYVGSQLGIPVVDLLPPFRAAGDEQLFVDMVHASAAGNRLVADQLEPVLRHQLGMDGGR